MLFLQFLSLKWALICCLKLFFFKYFNIFFWILAVSHYFNTKFCMTSYVIIIRSIHKPFIIIYRSFHILCPNRGWNFEKCFKTSVKGTFKKETMKDNHFDVAWTRKWADCGSDEEMRWLALHPSVDLRSNVWNLRNY